MLFATHHYLWHTKRASETSLVSELLLNKMWNGPIQVHKCIYICCQGLYVIDNMSVTQKQCLLKADIIPEADIILCITILVCHSGGPNLQHTAPRQIHYHTATLDLSWMLQTDTTEQMTKYVLTNWQNIVVKIDIKYRCKDTYNMQVNRQNTERQMDR